MSHQSSRGFSPLASNTPPVDPDRVLNSRYRPEGFTPGAKLPIVYSHTYNISFFGLEKIHPFDPAKWGKVFAILKGEQFQCKEVWSRWFVYNRPNSPPKRLLTHLYIFCECAKLDTEFSTLWRTAMGTTPFSVNFRNNFLRHLFIIEVVVLKYCNAKEIVILSFFFVLLKNLDTTREVCNDCGLL